MSSTSGKPSLKIYWTGSFSFRTDRLVDWCKENPELRAKLFLDLTQDARQENRAKTQLSSSKKDLHLHAARWIFENEEGIRPERFKENQKVYAEATGRQFSTLRSKYAELVKRLGQTGAGLDIGDLEKAAYKNIYGACFFTRLY
ncbi:hypothetical protein JVU11DRAFT_9570 [Chiua virens]|nr:hypothetical protein JVU11DRAFT_9570 [Chiua virens]